jgi:hypothetical protein
LSTLSSWSTPAAGLQKATARPAVPTVRSDLLQIYLKCGVDHFVSLARAWLARYFVFVFRPTLSSGPASLWSFGRSVIFYSRGHSG